MADRRPISDDVTALLGQLQRRETELDYAIRQYQRELGKVRHTMANLRTLRGTRHLESTTSRTVDIVLAYMDTVPVGARLVPADILEFADANEWASDALYPRGAIASVLVRMSKRGLVTRTGHGQYFKPEYVNGIPR
jgi:hypothetical protein